MEEFDISYLEANASKYVLRYDRKGVPLADLGKAKSYIERLLESRTRARRLIPFDRLQQFYITNDLNAFKVNFFDAVHGDGGYFSLKKALTLIDALVAQIDQMLENDQS
jgi:hypothetical protein